MQEDTEPFNENSNSEVIILPQSTHLEETLISDDEETDSETSRLYDTKLNAKLKELDLYEDGMTIQQKEELLAVVAVSFKTAEEEKSRRRWYEEYTNAALAFPEDEIEFSFHQSPELELSTKNSEDYQNFPSTSQQSPKLKLKPNCKRNNYKVVRSSYKLALEEGNTVTSHSPITVINCEEPLFTTNKQKKEFLEKCMGCWRPCSSPKEESLICLKRSISNDKTLKSSLLPPGFELKQRIQEYAQHFNVALTEIKQSRKSPSHFGKPYHLTKSGHCLKKIPKLDSFDNMIGVQEAKNEPDEESGVSNCLPKKKEALTKTCDGAFSYAQRHRDRINALRVNYAVVSNENSNMGKHSKLRCNSLKEDESRTFPEIVIEDGFDSTDITLSNHFEQNHQSLVLNCRDSSDQYRSESTTKSNFDTKLPKFSNLRPDLCQDSLSEKRILSRHLSLNYNCNESSEAHSSFRQDNHVDSSAHDGDLSDGSSVIDVETIVDDEIEEFVLKRKLIQEPNVSTRHTYSHKPKRLKKTT